MSRKELKSRARAQLGNGIFKDNWLYAVLVVIIEWVLVVAINGLPGIGAVASLLICGAITYGTNKLFLKQARDGQKMDVAGIFDGFKEDFGGNLLLGLIRSLLIALWSLLFVIPGIVKNYAYSMAFFVKADHPEYDWRTCLNESRRLMQGNKMRLFELDLSFWGWAIVGTLCFGIGTFWVTAYQQATHAQFYQEICGKTDFTI